MQLTWPGKQAQAGKQGNSVARLRASDHEAVEEFFNACYPRLAGWVRRLVDDDDTAHEIASEAFTRLLARWQGLDNPQSYVYMIATNLVRDHWRKTGRERTALRAMTAAGPPEMSYQPAPGRRRPGAHRSSSPTGCAAPSCCTTTAASGSRRWRPCWAARKAPSRRTCFTPGPA